MSTNVVSGGFPHLYSHAVPGSALDASAVRSVANADVAELHAALEPAIAIDDDVHLINVATKRALTATEFKQMFYARGDDEFSIANVYECPDIDSNILASVWGKRIVHTAWTAGGVVTTVNINDASDSNPAFGSDYFVTSSAHGYSVGTRLYISSANNVVDASNLGMPLPTSVWVTDISGTTGFRASLSSGGTAIDFPAGHDNAAALTVSPQMLPYNTSRVMNYNKLSSRPNDPSGVDLAYGYATDLQRNFYASHEVMGNLEKDLCVKKENWTLCSRIAIEDQLHSLAFSAEETDDVCMKVSCARKWSEVEDALAESCLAENNIIGLGDYVDLYINVRVTNGNADTKDTIIRIRFTVQLTRGPDDLGNWNVVASNAASAMLTTGIPYDGPEGGNLQYANAAQTELLGSHTNQQRTQAPDTTAPANLDTQVDPHDAAGNPDE